MSDDRRTLLAHVPVLGPEKDCNSAGQDNMVAMAVRRADGDRVGVDEVQNQDNTLGSGDPVGTLEADLDMASLGGPGQDATCKADWADKTRKQVPAEGLAGPEDDMA